MYPAGVIRRFVMKKLRTGCSIWSVGLALAVTAAVLADLPASALPEETFSLLEVGSHTYRNVTVTTKSKNYIFILHSSGMTNIKVSELPADISEKLGYAAAVPKVQTNNATVWAKQTMAK